MNNKRVLFYIISLFVLMSLYVIYVLAGATTGERIFTVVTSVSSNGVTLHKINVTTGANLNVSCTGSYDSVDSGATTLGNGDILQVTNLSLYHNINGSGPTGGLGLNISVNQSNFINLVNATQSGDNLTAVFVVYQNTSLTFNGNGALTGTTSPLTDGNFTFNCVAAPNITNGTYANISFQKTWGTNTTVAIDRVRPSFTLSTFNISDGINTLTLAELNTTGGGYLRNGTNIVIKVIVNEPYLSSVRLYWITNGSALPGLNAASSSTLNPNNLTMNNQHSPFSSNNNTVLNGSLRYAGIYPNGSSNGESIADRYLNFGDGVVLTFMLVANDSAGNLVNFSNNGRGFNITLDGTAPGATLSVDNTRVETLNSLKATCTSNDTSTVAYTLTLTKPSGANVIKEPIDGKATFKGTETGEAGKYTLKCDTKDSVGFTGTASKIITAFYSGEAEPSLEEVSGTEAEAKKVAELDLSKATESGAQPEGTIKGIIGESKTFTLDGATQHSLTFLQVNTQEVTLRFESKPVDVTLKVGETKEVDLDGDGTNDVTVTLSSIKDEQASVVVKSLQKVQPPAPETTTPEVPQSTGPSTTAMVVLVIVILAVVVAAYLLLKKGRKGKKGEVRFTSKDLSSEFSF